MSNTPIIQFPEPLEDPTQTEEVVVMGIAKPGLSKLEPPSKNSHYLCKDFTEVSVSSLQRKYSAFLGKGWELTLLA